MATATGMGFDLSKLDSEFKKLDKQLEALMKKGDKFKDKWDNIFKDMGKDGLNAFAKQLTQMRKDVVAFGKIKVGMKWDSTSLRKYIDDVNRLIYVIKNVQQETKKEGIKGLSIQGLKKELKDAQDLLKLVKQTEKDVVSASQKRQQSYSGALKYSDNVKTLEQEEKAIKNLEAARKKLKKTDTDYETKLRTLNDAIEKHNENIKNVALSSKQLAEQQAKTPKGALASYNQLYSPQGVRSLKQMRTVLKQLETAQANINTKTKQGQKEYRQVSNAILQVRQSIQQAERAAGTFNKQQKNAIDTAGQLKRALTTAFSVSAIKGYVDKLIDIRGEFEMQQRSLQVLLQDKDEANALWDKTVALAVKSPFRVKELVTYTKQLAAYRVESEKLYDTNKMLADVSAGLGVDMQRLILAFGQVKAANFLRGTELRQFSEAGVNMLDELAKRFSSLEGRVVSVGEVFERVSKRMVSFKDVEAVFQTITSEGGLFYQMQEKQAETLKGMMMNLKDSYDLMLDDIGTSSESTLKNFVSFMKTIVDNWRKLAPVIKAAGMAFATHFGVKALTGTINALNTAIRLMRIFFKGGRIVASATPFGAIATVLTTIITLIVTATKQTDKLTEAMSEVERSISDSLGESVVLYRKLTNTINDTTASLEDRNRAYEDLKSKFGEILPDQLIELEYIQSLSFNYREAESAMLSYYNAKAREQKRDKIEQEYDTQLAKLTDDIIKRLRDNLENTSLLLTDAERAQLNAAAGGIVNQVIEDAKNGLVALDEIEKEINDRLAKYVGKDYFAFSYYDAKSKRQIEGTIDLTASVVNKAFDKLEKILRNRSNALSDIIGMPYQTASQEIADNTIEAFEKDIQVAETAYNNLVRLRQMIAEGKIDLTSDAETLSPKQLRDRQLYYDNLNQIFKNLEESAPQYVNVIQEIDKELQDSAKNGLYEYTKGLGDISNKLWTTFAENAAKMTSEENGAQAMLTNFAQGIKETADNQLPTAFQQSIVNALDYAIEKGNLDAKGKDLLAKLLPLDSSQSTTDIRKAVEGLLQQYMEAIEQYNNAVKAGATDLPMVEYLNSFGEKDFKESFLHYLTTSEDFKNLQDKVIPVLQHFWQLLGGELDKKPGGGKDLVQERLKVIREVYEAYKELNKTFDETTSKTGALEKFGDAFYSAFGKTPEQMGYNLFTAEGVVDAYNKFIKTLSESDDIVKANLAKGDFVMELQVKIQQDADKKISDEIEQMFGGYELSLELEKLNIPSDVASRLFGIDAIDLSDIRKKIEDEIRNAEAVGGREDFLKERREELKKVAEMERKQQEEMLKDYSKYLLKAQSERVRIKIEEQNKIRDIEKLNIDEQDKRLMRLGVQNETKKLLENQAWEDFQASDMYIRLFDNLETASNASLNAIQERLESLRDSLHELDPSELKEINNQLEKIANIKVEKNPLKGWWDDVEKISDFEAKRKELEQGYMDASANVELYKAERDNAQLAVQELEKELATKEKLSNIDEATLLQLKTELERKKAYVEYCIEQLGIQEEIVRVQGEEMRQGENAIARMETRLNGVSSIFSELSSGISETFSNLENIFGYMDDKLRDMVESTAAIMQDTANAISDVGRIVASDGADVGAWFSLAKNITSLFGNISAIGDKKKERAIQAEIRQVEELQKAYERLSDVSDELYASDAYIANYNNKKELLDKQIDSIRKEIKYEEDKRKTDKERVKQMRNEITELEKTKQELEQEALAWQGGIKASDYLSTTEDIFDSMYESFKETGNALTGLETSFDDFFENLTKRQAMLRMSEVFAKQFDEINKMFDESSDGGITATPEEIAAAKKALEEKMPELKELFDTIMATFGVTSEASGKLNSLQGAISVIRESQADILASLLNSLRFVAGDNNTQIKKLVELQEKQINTPNPMESHLQSILHEVQGMHSLLSALRDVDHNALRVYAVD